MTRDEIRATIEGLERLATDECLCGDDRAIVRDALTLLREMTSSDVVTFWDAIDEATDTFADLDSERKAVQS